jgi:hypothetical protein
VSELNAQLRNHQPTMNEDGSMFIVTNSAADSWEENDLRLINFNKDVEVIACKGDDEEIRIVPDTPLQISNYIKFDSCILIVPFIQKEDIISTDDNIESITVTPEVVLESLSVKIYPNPFTNNLIITLAKEQLNSTMDLYDVSGRKVLTTKLNNVTNRIQFNQPGSGIYIYKLIDKTGKLISSGKLVKR